MENLIRVIDSVAQKGLVRQKILDGIVFFGIHVRKLFISLVEHVKLDLIKICRFHIPPWDTEDYESYSKRKKERKLDFQVLGFTSFSN